jgi:chitinase
LVGYWHNWQAQAASFVRLGNVSPNFDVINIAFALPSRKAPGAMTFIPYEPTIPGEFKADVAYIHSLGKKVLLSIGGANGSLALMDQVARSNFVESICAILQEYAFDGIDINLESKVILEKDDLDFRNPSSPAIINLIAAIKQIRAYFGPDFMLSMAPETICVQGGHQTYQGASGSYLPIVDGLRETLTYLHVQHYNSGAMTALDGETYVQGTADFQVAMAEMLLQGFQINQNPANIFPGLRPEQIVIGLPAFAHAASNGYTPPSEIQKALDYLTTGKSFGGCYKLRKSDGYSTFRGIMTWSINWDAVNYQHFSTNTRSYLDKLP